MFLGDLYLGLHNQMIFVYIGLLVSTFFGHYLKNFKVFTVLSIGLVGSLCFFLITNFGAWLILDVYEKNFNDLLKAYILAIPFFHNTLISTFLYLIVFKLIFEFATIKKIIKYPL